jgi:thiol-disulfide isomerase/thioredoxin
MSAKNLPVILAGLIVVGIIGVGAFFVFSDNADASSNNDSSTSIPSVISENQASNPSSVTNDNQSSTSSIDAPVEIADIGLYTDYSADLLSTDKTNILFFKADWCTTCNSLERNINSNLEQIPGDVQILVVDYDSETSLKDRYSVRTQHTLVEVDADGNEIQKWVGSPTLDSILSEV